MYENSRKDIPINSKFLNLSFFGYKLKIGVIGAGKAALIKTKTFLDKGCNVEVLALDFLEDFNNLNKEKLLLIKGAYNKEFIKDKHIVVIAIDDEKVVKEIVHHCESMVKLYINCCSFREGQGVVPVTRESKNMTISINTKLGNPKASIFMANKMLKVLEQYDDLVRFTSAIRNSTYINKEVKEDLLTFINSEDYEFFFNIGKHTEILLLFYNEKIISKIKFLEEGDEGIGNSTCN